MTTPASDTPMKETTMAKLGNITGSISIHIDGRPNPVEVATFDVPLRTSSDIKRGDTAATVEVRVDRTAFREDFGATITRIAEAVDETLSGETPGEVILTCPECGALIASTTATTVRHEADGAHSLDVQG